MLGVGRLQKTGLSAGLAFKPWRLLGIGFYQAWVLVAVMSETLFLNVDFFFAYTGIIRCYFSLSLALCMLLYILVSQKVDILGKKHRLFLGMAVASSVGTLLIACPFAQGMAAFAVMFAGISLCGLGNAAIVMGWGFLWSKMDADRMGLHIVVGNAFAGCLYLLIVLLPSFAAVSVAALLPLCSVGMLLLCKDEPPRTQQPPLKQSKGALGKALAAIATIPLVFGVARALSAPSEAIAGSVQYKMVLGMTVFAFVLVAVTAFAPKQQLAIRLYRLVVPFMVIGFAALVFVPQEFIWVPYAAIMCGFYSFEGLVWLLQPEYALQTKRSTLYVFGWGRCLFHFFGFLGALVGFWCIGAGLVQGMAANVLCFVMILILLVLSYYVFTEHDLRNFVAAPVRESALGPKNDACGQLALLHGLSERESEVLELLAKGRSVPYIAEALVISKGTVKTHVRHIYEKIGVHDKQELINLVDKAGE